MSPISKKSLWLSLLVAGALACALAVPYARRRGSQEPPPGATAPSARLGPIPFVAGEALEFAVIWADQAVGRLRTNVTSEGSTGLWHIAYELELDALGLVGYRRRGLSVLTPDGLLPVRVTERKGGGDDAEEVTTAFDRDAAVATITERDPGAPPEVEQVAFDTAARDLVGALFALRAVEFSPEGAAPEPFIMPLVDEDERGVLTAADRGTEILQTPAGPLEADVLRLSLHEVEDGRTQPGAAMMLWLAGPRRTPVRVRAQVAIGDVELRLVGGNGDGR
jgi:hypothetical protein